MILCPNCKKQEVFPNTLREKLSNWIVNHLFSQTIADERTDARMEGFSEGYRLSGKTGEELKQIGYQMARLEEQLRLLTLQIIKDKFPNV